MPPTHEMPDTRPHLEEKLEEVRTICRLHAYPTGRWENLIDLPFRLSQDVGLRSDITDIVRSLQRNNLNLPDVLDILVLAIGGNSAPRHARELSEQLDLLGGFLGNIGRWPATDSEPVLAPGEIPANIQNFTRPQPRSQPLSESPSDAASPTTPSNPAVNGDQSAAPAPSSAPQTSTNQTPAPQVRLYEAPRAQPVPVPRNESQQPSGPADRESQNPITPNPPPPGRPEEQLDSRQREATTPPSIGADGAGSRPQEPRSAYGDPRQPKQVEEIEVARKDPATPPQQAPASPDRRDPSEAEFNSITDIARALARLERGTFELRAHLDSIDQRISRMEPLLETGAPPPPAEPHPTPAQRNRPTPVLVPNGHAPSDPLGPGAQTRSFAPETDSPRLQTRRPEALRPEPIRPEPARPEPSAPNAGRQESSRAEPNWTQAHRSETNRVEPIRRSSAPPLAAARYSAEPHETHQPDLPRSEAPVVTLPSPGGQTSALEPTPVIPRFSRFSRDSAQPESRAESRAELRAETRPEPASPQLESAPPSSIARPMELPRGFFGTIPESHPADASDLDDLSLEAEAARRKRRRTAVVAGVLVLLGLAGGGVLYNRGVFAGPDAAVTTTPSPNPSGQPAGATPAPSPAGPLTSTPSRSPNGNANANAPSANPNAAHTPSQPPENRNDLGSAAGFRPAALFIPSSIMDGRLISAPLPQQPRVSGTAGLKGVVVMEANISSTGRVEDLHILGGSAPLRLPAIDAVRNWRYKPYLLNGSPVEVRTIIRVDFSEHHPRPAQRSAPFPA